MVDDLSLRLYENESKTKAISNIPIRRCTDVSIDFVFGIQYFQVVVCSRRNQILRLFYVCLFSIRSCFFFFFF